VSDEHPVVRAAVEAEPGIGSGDASPCLPGWIDSFARWHEKGEGTTLTPGMVRALLHTLIAARERARRLARERDQKP
jgi:hypothetical protein